MKKKQLATLSFIAAAVIGMVVLRVSTTKGVGIGGDATIYMTSAQNLLDGEGFGLIGPRGEFRIMPYFAPLFPLVLTIPGLLGASMETTAHWLNTLLFGALIWLAASETMRATKSLPAAWLAALLVIASPVLVPVYSWAMSEPLSLFLGILYFGAHACIFAPAGAQGFVGSLCIDRRFGLPYTLCGGSLSGHSGFALAGL